MQIKILGSAADGGFPQWNCACRNCSGLRAGTLQSKVRTQTQIAFSPISELWFLVGASPDLRAQVVAAPEFFPSPDSPGRSPIAGVYLTSAEVDAASGLLQLREFQNFFVFATPTVQRVLKNENRIFAVLERGEPPVQWQPLASGRRVGCHLSDNPGDAPTFFYSAVPLGGNLPDYASGEAQRNDSPGDSCVGMLLEQANKRLFIAPRLPGRNSEWVKIAASADVTLLDGTFWSDDELLSTGRTNKTARGLGHLPISGAGGLLEQFPDDARCRKILIHMNNTNPILDEGGEEHRAVVEAGWEIAYDGMEFTV
jgi:pyrroloquinoline quinone biosynthesis protein B